MLKKLILTVTGFLCLISFTQVFADTIYCPATYQANADWHEGYLIKNKKGNESTFTGATFALNNYHCVYNDDINQVLTNSFDAKTPNLNDPNTGWKKQAGVMICRSSNPQNCPATATQNT
jgi:hypothetical protein